jgi:hypothetical protein
MSRTKRFYNKMRKHRWWAGELKFHPYQQWCMGHCHYCNPEGRFNGPSVRRRRYYQWLLRLELNPYYELDSRDDEDRRMEARVHEWFVRERLERRKRPGRKSWHWK